MPGTHSQKLQSEGLRVGEETFNSHTLSDFCWGDSLTFFLENTKSRHWAFLVAQRKEPSCQCRRCGFKPWVGQIPWRGKWQPILVFLPWTCHGQRNLASYGPWGSKRVRHDLVTETTIQALSSPSAHSTEHSPPDAKA